ncbi:DUF4132 domain-containing protein [Glycomyces sp. NPDC049804]|uniref:DUF4132 domain-containing protein n=1 Tax=Glycomyces sp. NPDC049804 TaxID=3154363 RepID=UPI00342220DD
MTETETPSTALPDEDRLAFPPTWKRFVQPRRGDAKVRKVKLDPEAGREYLATHLAALHERFAAECNEEVRPAATAFLEGKPDVLGAAAVLLLANPSTNSSPAKLRPLFDLVAHEHGLPFAFAAYVEALTFDSVQHGKHAVGLERRPLNSYNWSRYQERQEIRDLRAIAAAASDEDYTAITAAVAPCRTDPEHRLAASFVLPDEQGWMAEVCDDYRAHQTNWSVSRLLLEVVASAEHLAALDVALLGRYWVPTGEIADLLHRLGAEALPVIEHYLEGHNYTDELKTLYRALAAMPGREPLGMLLDRIREPHVMGFAIEAAANFPRRAVELIAQRAPEADEAERGRLSAILHSDPILIDTVLPLADEATREALAALTTGREAVPEAPAEAVPALLASPPWTAATDASAPVVLKLDPLPISTATWAEGEREAWSSLHHHAFERHRGHEEWTPDRWTEATREFDALDPHDQAVMLALAPPETAAELLPRWKTSGRYYRVELLQRLMANLGAAAVAPVAASTVVDAEDHRILMLPFADLAGARYAADALVRLKTMRPFAIKWLDRHTADAAALLVPDALGRPKKLRAGAEAALRYLAATHGPDLVREAAARYGDEAAAAIGALVDIDPLMPVGIPIPKPAPWVSPLLLPQVLLNGREHALPHAAVRHLVTVLALGTPEFEYPGVAVVAAACDRTSLTRFSIALFEQWLTAGAPSEDGWALTQLAHFGGDEGVRLLQPLVAKWPGENQHKRAVTGLAVLGAIGTEAALRAINQIAEKAKFAAIKSEAADQIQAIAANLGLTAEQLADRLVPDFGLRDEAALVLDYGPRRFRVGFDEALKPFVTDMDGKPRKSLPKPGAKDDELLADAAYKRFAALRKDLRSVAADQVKRLERAMVQGRTWTPAEFDEHFVQHPLVWHLARRLVWIADHGPTRTAFRLAEDKGCSDVDENEFALPADAAVRLAHPAILDDVDAWAEILADYEVLQPFPQLARPVMAFTDEELRTGRLERFEGIAVPVGKLLGLTSRGWERTPPQDAGIEPGMFCELPGVGYVVFDLDPGITVGYVEMYDTQELRQVVVSRNAMHGWGVPAPKTDFGPVDPVIASELLSTLARLTDQG